MESDGISIPKWAKAGMAVRKEKQRRKVRIVTFFIITSIIAKKTTRDHKYLPDTYAFVALFAKFC